MQDWEKCKGCEGDLQHHHCPQCARPLWGDDAIHKPYENGVCFTCAVENSFTVIGQSYFVA